MIGAAPSVNQGTGWLEWWLGIGGQSDINLSALSLLQSGRVAGRAVAASTMATVACATNVVTVTTTAAHGLVAGQVVAVNAVDNTYDAAAALVASVPTATSFTYALTHGNEGVKADAGTVTPLAVLQIGAAITTPTTDLVQFGTAPLFTTAPKILSGSAGVTFPRTTDVQFAAAARVLGRGTAAAGAGEELVLSSDYGLTFTYAAASLKVNTPQDLQAAASPTFAGLALGAGSLTMTGSIAATGARVTKGWFTDLECTNAPTVGGIAMPVSGQTVQVICGWVSVTNHGAAVALGVMPANTFCYQIMINITEAFNGGAGNTLTVGWAADADALGASTSVAATATSNMGIGVNGNVVNASGQTITATFNHTGAEPTTGKVFIVCRMIMNVGVAT